jgi:hypothetical protein
MAGRVFCTLYPFGKVRALFVFNPTSFLLLQ